MHVEADLFCVCRPVLVAEAVRISAILAGLERVVASTHCSLVDLVCVVGQLDLSTSWSAKGSSVHRPPDLNV